MDNPLAFPTYDHHANGQQFLAGAGMTLRDYFAAEAMKAIALQEVCWIYSTKDAQTAKRCYEMADEMLKARGAQ